MIVTGMFVCSSFLISVCMFIVLKALLISSATVIVRAGGAIWLNSFATVLFSVCSTVTFVICTHVAWVCLVCLFVYDSGLLEVSRLIYPGSTMANHIRDVIFFDKAIKLTSSSISTLSKLPSLKKSLVI